MSERDEDRRRSQLRIGPALLLAIAIPAFVAGGQDRLSLASAGGTGLERALNEAVQRAAEKLANAPCQQVFGEFRSLRGDPILRTLAALGETGQSYLRLLVFYDGSGRRPCEAPEIVAFTSPGSRAVFVCPAQFLEKAHRDPGLAAALLIHEELHALGLGENPPSSREITARVIARCGR